MMKHKKLISDILFAIIIIILIGIIFYSLFKVREFTEDEINSPELRFWNLMFFTSILIFLIIGSLGFIVDIRKRREEFKKIIEKYSPTQLKVYKITLFLFISANLFFYICIFFIGYILFFNPNLRNDLFLEYFFNIGGIISMWMVIIALVLVCIFLSEEPSQEHREFRAKLKIRKVDHLFIIGFLMIGFVIILQVILLVRSPPVFILFIIETPVGLFFNLLLLLIGGILILIAIVKGMIITLRDYDEKKIKQLKVNHKTKKNPILLLWIFLLVFSIISIIFFWILLLMLPRRPQLIFSELFLNLAVFIGVFSLIIFFFIVLKFSIKGISDVYKKRDEEIDPTT